jgi:tetratricopeptide (TPR) repeat protein
MKLTGERMPFGRDGQRNNPYRILVYLFIIGAGLSFAWLVQSGQVEPAFVATPTPTRLPSTYAEEGSVRFASGDLEGAIVAFQNATQYKPDEPDLWWQLARIQTYSSALLTTAEDRIARLQEAKESIDQATEIAPDESQVLAIRALVYDWLAASEKRGSTERDEFLNDAFESAVRANSLDNENSMALAFYAEVLLDQQKYIQAEEFARRAVDGAESRGQRVLDVYRVYGTVLEGVGKYNAAISAYQQALEINPNLTFIHLLIGANYRQLRDIDRALQYFAEAERINEQNGVQDPTPYLAIGKTYMQQGEFFIAARNIERALEIDPRNPDIYGRLGIVYYKARNYESAVDVLRCAVDGCPPEVTRQLLCQYVYGCDVADESALAYCVDVPGQALVPESLEHYYTYGSVLAFYSYCSRAEVVFQELMADFGDDPIVSGIVSDGRAICADPGPTPQPTSTPEGEVPPCPAPGTAPAAP